MKTGGGSKERSPAGFPRELPSAEHVLARIKTITGELDALQAEIYGQAPNTTELLDRRSLLDQAGAARVLVDFKMALDQLRCILWFCESGSLPSTGATSNSSRSHRERELAPTHAFTKALSPQEFRTSSQDDSGSFFERLDRVIDNYMQQDKSTAKPAGRSKI